jgi:hypothetical protein
MYEFMIGEVITVEVLLGHPLVLAMVVTLLTFTYSTPHQTLPTLYKDSISVASPTP